MIPFPYVVIFNHVQKTFDIISEINPNNFTIISSPFIMFNNNNGEFINLYILFIFKDIIFFNSIVFI
jgi:hypothetical protein